MLPESTIPTHTMRSLLLLAAFFLIAVPAQADGSPPVRADSLDDVYAVDVEVSNLESTDGTVRVAFYDSKEAFPYDSTAATVRTIEPVSASPHTVSFEEVPAGTYGVAVIHDANENGELDRNFFGVPSEGYGFSRNAFDTFGPPDFEDAAVTIDDDTTLFVELE